MSDEHKHACRTCTYSFPAYAGESGTKYSCCITGKPVNAVVVRCEAYRPSVFEARAASRERLHGPMNRKESR